MYDLKILYAEDNEQSRRSYALGLRQLFKEVIEAKNGEEAFDLYRQHQPDILLTDINMPLLDGLELIRIIRKEDSNIKIIVLSAHADQEKLMKAIPLGLSSYLVKPIMRDALKKSLNDAASGIKEKSKVTLANGYVFDKSGHQLIYKDIKQELTGKEYIIINSLFEEMPNPVNYAKLAFDMWGYDDVNTYNNIQGIVARLRKKAPELIDSVYGYGYKIKAV